MTDKNLCAYCDNNPIIRNDTSGEFWDTFFDIASLVASVVDVVCNPTDPMAWAGLAADVICTITPCLTGGGTIVRAVSKADDAVDAIKTVNKVDTAIDVSKVPTYADFYVTNAGDVIPATQHGFYDNLSKMQEVNGKYYGEDSKGPVRIRVEQHSENNNFNGPLNPYHSLPHFHIDRRKNTWTGAFYKVFTGLMEWLR